MSKQREEFSISSFWKLLVRLPGQEVWTHVIRFLFYFITIHKLNPLKFPFNSQLELTASVSRKRLGWFKSRRASFSVCVLLFSHLTSMSLKLRSLLTVRVSVSELNGSIFLLLLITLTLECVRAVLAKVDGHFSYSACYYHCTES